MALIDLGELRGEPESGPRPGRSRRPAGPWPAALVLLVVLATVVGAEPVPRRVWTGVPAPVGAEVFRLGDLLLTAGPVRVGGDGSRELVAFALPAAPPDGRSALTPRWRTTVPEAANLRPTGRTAGIVLLTSNPDGRRGAEGIALGAATGRVHWRQPGVPLATKGGGVLLEPVNDESGTLRVVEPATGTLRWSMPTVPGQLDYRFTDEGIDRVLRRGSAGRVEVRDADTGAVLADAPVRAAGPAPEQTHPVGDLLVVVRAEPSTLSGYELDRLIPRWTSTVPSVGYVQPCGVVLCAWGQTGGVWALDPATGRVRWSDPRWTAAVPVGDRLVAITPVPGGSDRFLVLDAATGEVHADLGQWHGLRSPAGGRPPMTSRSLPGRGLMVAELDVVTGRARVRDVLPGSSDDCHLDSWPILCRQVDGSYRLWWPSG